MKKMLSIFLLIVCVALMLPGKSSANWFMENVVNGIPSEWDPIGKYLIRPIEEEVPKLKLNGLIRTRLSISTHRHPFKGTYMNNTNDPRMGVPPGPPTPDYVGDRSRVKYNVQNWEWLGELEAKYAVSDNIRFVAIGNFVYDAAYDVDSDVRHYFGEWKNDWQQWHYYRTGKRILKECYVDIDSPLGSPLRYRLRLGKQFVTWGRVDGARIMDIINPEDFREGPEHAGDDWEYFKLGLWMANFYTNWDRYNFQFLIIPDFEHNVFTHRSVNNSAPGHMWEFEMPPPTPHLLRAARDLGALPGQTVPIVTGWKKPSDFTLDDIELAVRFGALIAGWDFHVSYFYTWPDFPAPFVRSAEQVPDTVPGIPPGGLTFLYLELDHKRIHQFGANFEKTYFMPRTNKAIVFRGEMLYTINQLYEDMDEVDNQSKHNTWLFAFPIIEWTKEASGGLPWTFAFRMDTRIIEGFHDGLHDLPNGQTIRRHKNDFTFSILKFFYNARIFSLSWVSYDATQTGWWFHTYWSLDFTDKIKGMIEYNHYEGSGPPGSLTGQFENRDNIGIGFQYSF